MSKKKERKFMVFDVSEFLLKLHAHVFIILFTYLYFCEGLMED